MASIPPQKHEPLTATGDHEQLREDIADLKAYIALRLSEQDHMLTRILHEKHGDVNGNGLTISVGAQAPIVLDIDSRRILERLKPKVQLENADTGVRTLVSDMYAQEQKHKHVVMQKSLQSDTEDEKDIIADESGLGLFQNIRKRLAEFISRKEFDLFIVSLVFSNIIVMAVELEVERYYKPSEMPAFLRGLNSAFNAAFLTEVLMKWLAFGPYYFFTCPDWLWNMLDFLIVCSSVLEWVTEATVRVTDTTENGSLSIDQFRMFRILRVTRVLRGIKVARIFKHVAPLRSLLISIGGALKSCFWTLVLITFIIFGFAFAIAQASLEYCKVEAAEHWGHRDVRPLCTSSDVNQYWNSLGKSMFTLYMIIVAGINWIECLDPLYKISDLAVFCLAFYVAVMYLCVLNVVNGVFCQNAIESASNDKEIAVATQLSQSENQTDGVKAIFQQIDNDKSGEITFDELVKSFQSPEVSAFFESIDLDVQDVWTVFHFLDSDKNGTLNCGEFVEGCMMFRGTAKAIHVAKIKNEQLLQRALLEQLRGEQRTALRAVDNLQDRLEDVCQGILGLLSAGLATPSQSTRAHL
mmetsp:Transcript_106948/g.190128  ORF Transcript_106948/g.190128 Transcript_106948/m.190128 type:complete len:581 (+) Transcript_106948:39-1781(+)